MRLAGAQRAADADDERRVVLAHEGVLAFLRRQVRITIFQLLRRDKRHLALQLRQHLKLRINRAHGALRVTDSGNDIHDRRLEIVQIPVAALNDFFPVPLIDVDRVQIVEHILVAADGVHVGIKALAGIEIIAVERHALPLGERLDDLRLLASLGNIEQNRALVAVEIVVQAAGLFQKQRRRNAKQIQLRGELILKQTFEQADGLLRVINAEQALIALGDIGVHALFSSLSVSIRTSV